MSLSPLANDLFSEAVNLARAIGGSSDEDKPSVLDLCRPRFEVIRRVLMALEAGAGLSFVGRVPIIYNGSDWPSPVPAGYTSSQDIKSPRPFEAITSIMVQCSAARRGDSYFGSERVHKAVTFIAWRDGFTKALEYLFDLVDYGYIPYASDAASCLEGLLGCLVAMRAQPNLSEEEASRRWALKKLPQIASLHSGGDWRDATLESYGNAFPATGDIYHERIIRHLLRLVEETRDSSNLGEFIVNQIRAGHALKVFALLEKRTGSTSAAPIALRVVSSQLEEIRADAGALPWIIAGKHHAPSGGELFKAANGILCGAGESPTFRRRMEDQRLLSPRALGRIPREGYASLPEEWEKLDYRLAYPLTALARGPVSDLRWKKQTTPLGGRSMSRAEREGVGRAYNALIIAPPEERITLASKAVSKYPWSPDFRLELAIAIDQAGQPLEALPYAQSAVFLTPEDHMLWQSLSVVLAHCGATAGESSGEGRGRGTRQIPYPVR